MSSGRRSKTPCDAGRGAGPSTPTAVALATLGVLRTLARSRPTIVTIDDLQWVDAPSLRALTFAFRRVDDEPLGLLATVGLDSMTS